jgi:hypothetical protein
MEYMGLDVRPELREAIFSHESEKTPHGAKQRAPRIGLAIGPPGVGEEVVSGSGNISGIRRRELAVAIVGKESHDHDIL